MVRHGVAVLAGLVLAAASFAASGPRAVPLPLNKVVEWKTGDVRSYEAGELTLTFRPKTGHDDRTSATLTISMAEGPGFSYAFSGGFDKPSTQFAVGRLDPDTKVPQVILAPYSGGAHCCLPKIILVLYQGKWRVRQIDAGLDSDEFVFPKDIDGDGRPDFALFDDRFAYVFGCFACSWLPTQVFYLQGDKIVDGTASGRYDRILRDDLAKAKQACVGKDAGNGYCAGVAADGARLRQFEANWLWLLKHYPRSDNWGYPEGCTIDMPEGKDCPADKAVKFISFPESLAWFLRRNGYISRAQERWAAQEAAKAGK